MIYRDLIERYNYSNITAVKYIMKRLASNTCSYVSVLKIYNELRSQGIKTDKNLLYHVFEAAQNIYLTMPVLKFDYSLIKQSNADKKVYFVDNGLLNALTIKFSDNNGLLLENLVYLHYKRSAQAIYYYKNGKKCDFIVEQMDGKIIPVQVTWELKEEATLKRELSGMVAACKYLKVKKGIMVTRSEERLIKSEGISIQLISVIDLLLSKK